MALDFEFYTGGLETSIIKLLKEGNADLEQPGMTGVKEFSTYSGELDRENLLDALKSQINRFPLVLISYGSGSDKRKAATGLLENEPIETEHRCGFVVVVASNDLRGQRERRTSAFKMIAEVRKLLGGVQFEINVEGEDVLLNHEPFLPVAVETIVRLTDITAYAVHFSTMFHEWTPNRRIVSVGRADEILLDVKVNANNRSPEFNLPGVTG